MPMKLSECLPYLLYEFKNEHELIRAIEEISVKFTKEREKINDYLNDPRLVSAYTAFYVLTNIPKLSHILNWLPQDFVNSMNENVFVDLGAGPGTFSLAYILNRGKGKVIQIETSKLMREQAFKLWNGLNEQSEMVQSTVATQLPNSTLLFGHSANEMTVDEVIRYIDKINPSQILFIEPGTKLFFESMLSIRMRLIERGFNVVYPCVSQNHCPMSNDKENWCHQFIEVRHDPEVERLSQILKKDRRHLPMIVQAFSKSEWKENHQKARIVRVFPETKFSFEWEICFEDKIIKVEIQKRPYSKSEIKDLGSILSGAEIEFQIEKVMYGKTRIKLTSYK